MSQTELLPPPSPISPRAAPDHFACSWSRAMDVARVHVTGELDLAAAPGLELALREAELHARLVIVDLRELTFIDCSGVRAIVTATVRARRAGRRLIVVRGPAQTDRVLALAGASDALEITDPDAVERTIRAHRQLDHPMTPTQTPVGLSRCEHQPVTTGGVEQEPHADGQNLAHEIDVLLKVRVCPV